MYWPVFNQETETTKNLKQIKFNAGIGHTI